MRLIGLAVVLTLSLCLAPLAGEALQAGKVYRIGLFHVGLDHVPPSLDGLRKGLKALGYDVPASSIPKISTVFDGSNIRLDWRNLADERAARQTAKDFVRDRVDLIVAFENQAVRAAQAATAEGPVFFLHVSVAEDVRRTPGLTLKPVHFYGDQWLLFTEQWDPKSPWADRRVRLAVNHAIDRQAINQSVTLGFSRITGSIIPQDFDFYWPAPPYAYDPRKAKQLLAEAGYKQGFDAGELWTDAGFAEQTEAVANYLAAVGLRTRIRTLERAAYFSQLREKKLRPLVYVASAAYGNAATRLDSFVAAGGLYAYGSYPDIEGLIQEQTVERDRKRREATLHRIQQLMYERAMFAPIWDIAVLTGYGPRVAEPGLGLIGSYLFSAPYEDVRLKGR